MTTPDPIHSVTAFSRISDPKDCDCCGECSVEYEGPYPSQVEPFASQMVQFCTKCGVGFVPNAAEVIADYYSEAYATKNRRDRKIKPSVYFSEEHRQNSKAISRYFNRAKSQLELAANYISRMDAVLDFGSGPGYLLYLSEAKEKVAFELDRHSSKYLKYIGAKQLDDLNKIPRGKFDLALSSHSLEHLPAEALVPTLNRLLRSLKRDGVLYIEVPQGGQSFITSSARQDPHTIFFTPEALETAVVRAGGKIEFKGALGKSPCKKRPDAIYTPSGSDAFHKERRGRLTIIARDGGSRGLLFMLSCLFDSIFKR